MYLWGASPWGCWGSDMTERLHFHFSFSCIEEGNGNPLQCSCLENPRDRGAWWAAVYGVVQSWTQLKRLSSSSSSSIVFRVRYWNIQLWMLISPFLFFLQVRQLLLAVFWGSLFRYIYKFYSDFPGDSDGKESTCSMGDLGSIAKELRPCKSWRVAKKQIS